MVADNKVYVGSRGRDFWILEDSRMKHILDSAYFDRPIASTPTVDDGVLYVATASTLYAIEFATQLCKYSPFCLLFPDTFEPQQLVPRDSICQ
jgi:outer membrane protein assembly factor BamB